MGFFEEFYSEITNMDLDNFIVISLIFGISFYFSKKAQNLFLHLLYSGVGIYLLLTIGGGWIIYDTHVLVGLGLIIPQIKFLSWFIPHTINTIKMMTSNTYFFFISIYYKILRFINWLISIINMIKILFNTKSFKKEDYSNDENTSNSSYEDTNHNYQQESTYEEEQNSYSHEKPKQETKKEKNETFSQFYSSSAYIILGVNQNDDFKTIKKAYRALTKIYHPDLNPNDIKLYTEITQNINSAYEKLEKIHK